MKYKIQNRKYHSGFSLTEVLLAVGTFAVGMLFIAGVFPVSIHFTTVAAERTIAAAAADEAFAKVILIAQDPCCPLYAADLQNPPPSPPFSPPAPPPPPPPFSVPFEDRANAKRAVVVPPLFAVLPMQFAYPSTGDPNIIKQFWWSALCRRVGPSDVQVTVFVCRKAGTASMYYVRDAFPPNMLGIINRPAPVFISVAASPVRTDELVINDPLNLRNFISDGYTIVDDATGNIYRVLERRDNIIRLDRQWLGPAAPLWVWTVPASVSVPPSGTSGRYPCIAVYQKVMSF